MIRVERRDDQADYRGLSEVSIFNATTKRESMKTTLMLGLAGALLGSIGYVASYAQNESADRDSFRTVGARFTAEGQLIRPEGWRKWVYIGTPLTPHDMNEGAAAFPEFHNVYIDPDSFGVYENTGEFPDGTMIAKNWCSSAANQPSAAAAISSVSFKVSRLL